MKNNPDADNFYPTLLILRLNTPQIHPALYLPEMHALTKSNVF